MGAVDIACVGDLMFECIVHDASPPAANSTLVVDSPGQELGGAAFNPCWNLARLGRLPRLVAPFGQRQAALVRETLAAAALSDTGLIEVAGDTDLLVVLVQDGGFRSVYLRGSLPDRLADEVRARLDHPGCLILVGSRHPALRRVSVDLAEGFNGQFLVFSPAYAIYEYAKDELQRLSRRAHVTIMNRYEADYMQRTLGAMNLDDLGRSFPGIVIVTLAHAGAWVFERGGMLEFPSYARSHVDAFGAGDAFLAGFLIEKLRGADTTDAARFASMCGAYVVDTGQIRVALAEATVRRWLLERVGK